MLMARSPSFSPKMRPPRLREINRANRIASAVQAGMKCNSDHITGVAMRFGRRHVLLIFRVASVHGKHRIVTHFSTGSSRPSGLFPCPPCNWSLVSVAPCNGLNKAICLVWTAARGTVSAFGPFITFLRLLYFGRTGRSGFRRRTPGPPPFSAMNSMPAFSRAPRTSSSVRGYGSLAPRSKSAIVFVAVLLASERSD